MNKVTKDKIDYLVWHIAQMLDSFDFESRNYIFKQLKLRLGKQVKEKNKKNGGTINGKCKKHCRRKRIL